MCHLFETIRIENGKLWNLSFHNERLNRSIKELFGTDNRYDLGKIISMPENLPKGKVKCRVLYTTDIVSITFQKYEIRKLSSLRIVENDSIEYAYKFEDRKCLEELKSGITSDDILIVKNGYITDTSFTNLIFWDGTKWITPATPLLKGTMRAMLLDEQKIYEEDIRKSEIRFFKCAGLINAMMGLDDCIKIDINNIT
jgi:4-amino-4-deoxychorismate lyase